MMQGKKGLVMGVANDRSIAWGIAKKLSENGAELAFTYFGDALKKRVSPLAESINSKTLMDCNVENKDDVKKTFKEIQKKWGKIDFVVHAIAFSDRGELSGQYINTSRENFLKSMLISCFSFTEVAKEASKIMNEGSSMITLTYESSKVIPNWKDIFCFLICNPFQKLFLPFCKSLLILFYHHPNNESIIHLFPRLP